MYFLACNLSSDLPSRNNSPFSQYEGEVLCLKIVFKNELLPPPEGPKRPVIVFFLIANYLYTEFLHCQNRIVNFLLLTSLYLPMLLSS